MIPDFICVVWGWLGTNSGQLQTIFAVLAFGLAYKGYVRLLEQIKFSNSQRSRDAKMVFINLLHEAYKENIKYIQLGRKLENMAKTLKEIENLNDKEHAIIDRYLPYLKNYNKTLKSIKIELERIYDLSDQLKIEALEKNSFTLNQKMKGFVKASNGFNVIELDFQKILDKYKN